MFMDAILGERIGFIKVEKGQSGSSGRDKRFLLKRKKANLNYDRSLTGIDAPVRVIETDKFTLYISSSPT